MSSIIAIGNNKGGTGKTTSTASLAVALLELRQGPILMVDCDPTGALSASFHAIPADGEKTIYHALLERGMTLKRVIRPIRKGLDLAPSNRDLAAAEIILATQAGGELLLKKALEPLRDDYAFILLDCPPNLGKLTVAALTAADSVIIPLTPAYLSLNPLSHLFETVQLVRDRLNPKLHVLGLLLTQFNRQTLHAQEVEERVRSLYPDLLFSQVIGQTVRIQEAPAGGQTILDYRPLHPASIAYREVAKEVLTRAQTH